VTEEPTALESDEMDPVPPFEENVTKPEFTVHWA
jgi:hypothetical protein